MLRESTSRMSNSRTPAQILDAIDFNAPVSEENVPLFAAFAEWFADNGDSGRICNGRVASMGSATTRPMAPSLPTGSASAYLPPSSHPAPYAQSAGELAGYVDQAVHNGQLAANVVSRVIKALMTGDMAREFGDRLLQVFFEEYVPETPQQRVLVEHAAVVHTQLLVTRAKWGGATSLPDIEALTRVQSRLSNELVRLLDALSAQREGQRTVIANANIATNQIVQQVFDTNELG